MFFFLTGEKWSAIFFNFRGCAGPNNSQDGGEVTEGAVRSPEKKFLQLAGGNK